MKFDAAPEGGRASERLDAAPEGGRAKAATALFDEEGVRPHGGPPSHYKNIMISAGESSGEMHGAVLIEKARALGLAWKFFGLGGDRMKAAGAELLAHIDDTAVMGFTEVIGSLGRILSVRGLLKAAIRERRPDALVLIDFPDFNLGLAKAAKVLGIPVIYYICPQVWAWRSSRLKKLARLSDRRALLFAFEKKFYEERGVSADWVGHPIFDGLPDAVPREAIKARLNFDPERPLVAFMPGSRRSVVKILAEPIFGAAARLAAGDERLAFVVSKADSIPLELLEELLTPHFPGWKRRVKIIGGHSREILAAADLSLMASGTSSVEATILGAPHLVTYKGSAVSWFLAKRLVSAPFASIANIVAGREIVPEFLQDDATAKNLAGAAREFLSDGRRRERMIADLSDIKKTLGGPGASERVLKIIAEEMEARS